MFNDPLVALEEIEWLVATTNRTHCIYQTRGGFKVGEVGRYFPSDRVIAVLNCRNVTGERVLNACRGQKNTLNTVKTMQKKASK